MNHFRCLSRLLSACLLSILLSACQVIQVDVSTEQYPPFIKAAQQGDIAEAERLLKAGQLIDQTSIGNETAFHIAAAEGQDQMVTWLFAHDANLLAKTQNGETPADFARTEGKTSTEKLIASYADLLRKEEAATTKGDWETLRQLLATDVRRYTVLHVLVQRGYIDAAKKEIQAGADVNAKTVNGLIPLHKVIVTGNIELAKLLLDSGADVNARDIYNATPLFYAISLKNKGLVELYLGAGADPNIRVVWRNENALETAKRIGDVGITELIQQQLGQP